ncbi:hypothetical protein [Polaribacter sejongensis]
MYFKTITDCILSIKDDLKVLQIKSIRITDLENFQKFCYIFSADKFRGSIREYRDTNGRENLKQELRLILSAIKDYSKFYSENQISLNSIDTIYLLKTLIKPIELQETLAYRKQIPTNKSITKLTGDYENMSLRLSDKHPEIIAILKKIQILKKEKEGLLNIYNEWIEERKTLERKYYNLLGFNFYNLLLNLEAIENIIEQDYLENIELLSLNFNNDLLEMINEYFTPPLTAVSAKDFFNEIQLSGIKLEMKKMSDTKFYFFVDCLSKTIKGENHKEIWIKEILDYFEKDRGVFDKKKTFEKTKYDGLKGIDKIQNNFAYKLLNAIQKV